MVKKSQKCKLILCRKVKGEYVMAQRLHETNHGVFEKYFIEGMGFLKSTSLRVPKSQPYVQQEKVILMFIYLLKTEENRKISLITA